LHRRGLAERPRLALKRYPHPPEIKFRHSCPCCWIPPRGCSHAIIFLSQFAGGIRMMTQKRPQSNDYAPYYGKYVMLVPEGDFLQILEQEFGKMKHLLEPLTEQQADFRYAPGKWSIKETLGHVNDAERIFAVRILRIARGDQTPLPGFEQDDYVRVSNAASRTLSDLLEEFAAVRRASVALIRSL